MADNSDEGKPRAAPEKADSRQARLSQALRANLLKRKDKSKAKTKVKAKAKAANAGRHPPEEGGQAEG